jgi:hypothetical protein
VNTGTVTPSHLGLTCVTLSNSMEYVIGIVLGLAVTGGATAIGFDRERVFYPAVLIVIATYYVLFAAMDGSTAVVIKESIVAGGFVLVAVIGFKTRLWLVAAAIAAHGIFDFFHHFLIDNSGVPHWWPGFCMAIDVTVGIYLAILLMRRSRHSPNRG